MTQVNKDKLSYEIVKKSCSTLFMYISNIVDYVLPAADKADSANIGDIIVLFYVLFHFIRQVNS